MQMSETIAEPQSFTNSLCESRVSISKDFNEMTCKHIRGLYIDLNVCVCCFFFRVTKLVKFTYSVIHYFHTRLVFIQSRLVWTTIVILKRCVFLFFSIAVYLLTCLLIFIVFGFVSRTM